MSDYATLQQLKDLLGSSGDPNNPAAYEVLTDRVGQTDGDDAVGQAILDRAEGTIHSYIGGRYEIPVNTSGDAALANILLTHTLNLAAHIAYLDQLASEENEPEDTKRGYDETMAWLRQVAAGKIPLPGDPASPPTGTAKITAKRGGDDRRFNTSIYGGGS